MGRTRVARGSSSRAAAALVCGIVGCSSAPESRGPQSAPPRAHEPTLTRDAGEAFSFPEATASPLGLAQDTAYLQPFLDQCKLGDAALSRVAERFARRRAEGRPPLDASELSFALRAEGSPYVWPRAWALEGGDLASAAAVERMRG